MKECCQEKKPARSSGAEKKKKKSMQANIAKTNFANEFDLHLGLCVDSSIHDLVSQD